MDAPRLTFGDVSFTVPTMNARILRDRAPELAAFLAIERAPLSGEQVNAIVLLISDLATAARVSLKPEELETLITTRNMGEMVRAIGYAYFAPADEKDAPAGEAGSPSISTSTGSPGT